jgi:hypothetical protein
MLNFRRLPGIDHLKTGANLLSGNAAINQRRNLSSAFDLKYTGKKSRGD